MKEWEKHVRQTASHFSECWVRLYSNDWAFIDAEHVTNAILMGTGVQPCPKCLKAMLKKGLKK